MIRSHLPLVLSALVATHAVAYDHPLGSHAIREAYFIGAGNYVEGLAGYTKSLPVPKTGPHVAEMEVRTPFAQVVLMSSEHSVGYSAQQAAQDYRKNPDILQVRVEILSTATFSFISPLPMLPTLAGGTSPGLGDARWPELRQGSCGGIFPRVLPVEQCFRDFRFEFSQGKKIKPKSSYGLSINSGDDTIGDRRRRLVCLQRERYRFSAIACYGFHAGRSRGLGGIRSYGFALSLI